MSTSLFQSYREAQSHLAKAYEEERTDAYAQMTDSLAQHFERQSLADLASPSATWSRHDPTDEWIPFGENEWPRPEAEAMDRMRVLETWLRAMSCFPGRKKNRRRIDARIKRRAVPMTFERFKAFWRWLR